MRLTRVLVAEDSDVYGTALTRFIASQPDMEVVGRASDGEGAIRMADSSRPDVVLMDVCMPGIGGVEATRLIVQTTKEVRVIALTADDTAEVEHRCITAGASAFLSKWEADQRLPDVIRRVTSEVRAQPGGECQSLRDRVEGHVSRGRGVRIEP